MSKYPPVAEVVGRIKESAEKTLRIIPSTLPAAVAKKDAVLAHNNVLAGGSSCVRAAMVYARYDRDYAAAKEYCSRCADYADALTDMARQGLKGTPWSGFYVLYCSVIAGRFDKAEQVADWILGSVVAEQAADPHDPLAVLSAYAVLDRRATFENYRAEWYDASWHAKHPFFGPLSVYLDLWHAVLKRDQAGFDAAMLRREERHVRLSKEKHEGRLEFGGGEVSKYIVDFMGIGCAIVARHRGLSCDVDTLYLPRAMVDMAIGTS